MGRCVLAGVTRCIYSENGMLTWGIQTVDVCYCKNGSISRTLSIDLLADEFGIHGKVLFSIGHGTSHSG